MAKSVAAEAIRRPLAAEIERGAQDVLPTKRPPDGESEVLPGDLVRLQAVELQTRHAARTISRQDPQLAQPIAAEAGGTQGAKQVGVAQRRLPLWLAVARLV